MSTTRKVVIGIGLAGGALLAAWLLTGNRKKKTREFIAKKAGSFKRSLNKVEGPAEDRDAHYV
jgi:hypothetical protein